MSVKRALIAIDHVRMFRARTVNAILASGALFTRAGEVRGPWCGAADLLFKRNQENSKRESPNSPARDHMDVYRVRTCTNAYSAAPQSTRDGYGSPGITQGVQTRL